MESSPHENIRAGTDPGEAKYGAPRARAANTRSSRNVPCAETRMTAANGAASFGPEANVIPRHEDVQLVDAARRGDHRARESLVARHLPSIRSIAFRYRRLGLPFEDLVQEGSLGLLDAIDHFEPERGVDFESYSRFR